jgi:antitoxin PrlF
MITSRLTSRARTTIPLPVRKALQLQHGDDLAYAIEDGRVILTRKSVLEAKGVPFVTFDEWASKEDARAYAGL